MKIWLNGHEWAKRQALKAGIGFTELSNGFATCTDPTLQAICDRLGPGAIRVFAERWWSILPLPLTEHDRAGGYWWELSMRQIETRAPWCRRAPACPRVLRGAGRRQPRHRPPGADRADLQTRPTPRRQGRGQYKTKIVTYGTEVNVNAFYRHSRIKQYLKDGRAAHRDRDQRPGRSGCRRRLQHLDELQTRARAINTTLLDTERVGQGCVLRVQPLSGSRDHPTEDGRRAPALRFGDPRVQALAGALCTSVLAVTGITNKSLRLDRAARR